MRFMACRIDASLQGDGRIIFIVFPIGDVVFDVIVFDFKFVVVANDSVVKSLLPFERNLFFESISRDTRL